MHQVCYITYMDELVFRLWRTLIDLFADISLEKSVLPSRRCERAIRFFADPYVLAGKFLS